MKDKCVKATEDQIKMEVTASMKYLSMGAFFSRDDINRPGFAKMFFEAAGEEREHAYKLIEYLSMRGRYLNKDETNIQSFSELNITKLVKDAEKATLLDLSEIALEKITNSYDAKVKTVTFQTSNGLNALRIALKLEVAVTKSIRNLVESCESDNGFNHYHVSFPQTFNSFLF